MFRIKKKYFLSVPVNFNWFKTFSYTPIFRIVKNADKIVIHPSYNYNTNENDIALIKMTSKVNILRFWKPCLIDDSIYIVIFDRKGN